MSLSDEALLERLNEHPELRRRVESMLLVVADEKGELQAAKAAELAGQEAGVWRGGKKNSSGTAPLVKSA